MSFAEIVELIGKSLDAVGVGIIVVGALIASIIFTTRLVKQDPFSEAFLSYRHRLGRAILLGLEFLVAGDIIRTVAISPTFRSVGILAAIVLVRTFLSMSLDLELNGRWPWQARIDTTHDASAGSSGGGDILLSSPEPLANSPSQGSHRPDTVITRVLSLCK